MEYASVRACGESKRSHAGRNWIHSHPSQDDEKVIVPEVPGKFETTIHPGSNEDGGEAEPGPSNSVELSSSVMVTAWWCGQR